MAVRHIGYDLGRAAASDEDVLPLLRGLRRPTLFTLDRDFFRRELCHERYCLVWLDVRASEAAEYARRFLGHREFDTKAKRMGAVLRVTPDGLHVWRLHGKKEIRLTWQERERRRKK